MRRLRGQPVRRRLGGQPHGAGAWRVRQSCRRTIRAQRPCVVYASEQVHMSIPKAVALLGIGRNNLRLDSGRRRVSNAAGRAARPPSPPTVRPDATPIAIVATVGTVVTGAIDPLPEIADIAQRESSVAARRRRLWRARGIGRAREIPWAGAGTILLSLDAHKWLYQPHRLRLSALPRSQVARETFSHSGDYVRILNEDPAEAFAFFEESIELSRRFRALKLWMSLQYHGRRAFREAIAPRPAHAQLLAETIRSQPELELLAPVPLSAVCFRHRHKDNQAILRRVIARGRVYLSNATIGGQFALRRASSIIAPRRTTSGRSCRRSWPRPTRSMCSAK